MPYHIGVVDSIACLSDGHTQRSRKLHRNNSPTRVLPSALVATLVHPALEIRGGLPKSGDTPCPIGAYPMLIEFFLT